MRAPRAVRDRLLDILDAVEKARLAVGDLTPEGFRRDWLRQAATVRFIEIISEASRHVPAGLKETAPDIPWLDIADIGNVLRHGYQVVDTEVVWRVVRYDLNALEAAVRTMLARLDAPT